MGALLTLFRFLVPYFDTMSDADVTVALELAATQRPDCLTTQGQDMAQVWYAAWLLYQREVQTKGAASPLPYGIKSEKEGDLQVTYGVVDGSGDPFDYWGRFKNLAKLCGGTGAITVGNGCRGRLIADYADDYPPWLAPSL